MSCQARWARDSDRQRWDFRSSLAEATESDRQANLLASMLAGRPCPVLEN
ncbi:hypothetical protein A2U01_0106771, partial [Trifolium medium]|nr:hypothetical protein [Trifolium medium]